MLALHDIDCRLSPLARLKALVRIVVAALKKDDQGVSPEVAAKMRELLTSTLAAVQPQSSRESMYVVSGYQLLVWELIDNHDHAALLHQYDNFSRAIDLAQEQHCGIKELTELRQELAHLAMLLHRIAGQDIEQTDTALAALVDAQSLELFKSIANDEAM